LIWRSNTVRAIQCSRNTFVAPAFGGGEPNSQTFAATRSLPLRVKARALSFNWEKLPLCVHPGHRASPSTHSIASGAQSRAARLPEPAHMGRSHAESTAKKGKRKRQGLEPHPWLACGAEKPVGSHLDIRQLAGLWLSGKLLAIARPLRIERGGGWYHVTEAMNAVLYSGTTGIERISAKCSEKWWNGSASY